MKLRAIDIMGRVMRIEVEQTRKIARETSVCALVLHFRKHHVSSTSYLLRCTLFFLFRLCIMLSEPFESKWSSVSESKPSGASQKHLTATMRVRPSSSKSA